MKKLKSQLKVYNTLTRKKEIFQPLKDKKVNMFVCGPTVYDSPHLGHAKTYIQFDIIVKYLRYLGYNVFYLQNVTNIDDKIINRAKELEITPKALAKKFEKEYYRDIKTLHINSVNKYARATDYIKQIVSQVERLIKKSCAYKIEEGYYFDLSKFKEYGKLSKRTALTAEDAVSRIDDSINKRNKGDFCLWKFSKPNELYWETEIGKGRPGWHIEDTAITETYFGPQYDIHGGAIELSFPHHEAEIAQMESLSGKRLVKYWLHTGILNVDNKKMSKSLGDFITIKDAIKKYDYKTLRFFYISTHYRSPINYTKNSLEQAKSSLQRLNEFMFNIKNNKKETSDKLIKETENKFLEAMNDDFDTPGALAVIFDFIREVNKAGTGGKKAYNLILEFNKIFDILNLKQKTVSKEILKLIKEREKAREKKDWKKADSIREELKRKGIIIEDTEKGSIWKIK